MRGVHLDHATIDTADVAESVRFYEKYLGLKTGWRPDFGFEGAWLYPHDGNYPIVHLIQTTVRQNSGMFNHIAFRGEGLAAYRAKLQENDVAFDEAEVPGTPFTQIHHLDPNGVKIEVLFESEL